MTHEQRDRLVEDHRSVVRARDVIVPEIPDEYRYMDPELVDLLRERVDLVVEDARARQQGELGEAVR